MKRFMLSRISNFRFVLITLFSTEITSLWVKRPGLCVSRKFLSILNACFSFSVCQGLAPACECGTSWT